MCTTLNRTPSLAVFHDIHCLDFIRKRIPVYSTLDNVTKMHFGKQISFR